MKEKTMYILTWQYYDGSELGILGRLLSDKEVRLIKLLEKEGMMDSSKKFRVETVTVDESED